MSIVSLRHFIDQVIGDWEGEVRIWLQDDSQPRHGTQRPKSTVYATSQLLYQTNGSQHHRVNSVRQSTQRQVENRVFSGPTWFRWLPVATATSQRLVARTTAIFGGLPMNERVFYSLSLSDSLSSSLPVSVLSPVQKKNQTQPLPRPAPPPLRFCERGWGKCVYERACALFF